MNDKPIQHPREPGQTEADVTLRNEMPDLLAALEGAIHDVIGETPGLVLIAFPLGRTGSLMVHANVDDEAALRVMRAAQTIMALNADPAAPGVAH